MKNLVDNMNNQSEALQKAWEAFKTEGDKYGNAVNNYLTNKEGSIHALKEQYKEVMKLYNTYNDIAKNEKVNAVPPPPPPVNKSTKKGPQVDEVPLPHDAKTGYVEVNGETIYYITQNNNTKYFNRFGKLIDKNGKLISPPPVQQKATPEQLAEYNKLVKKFNSQPEYERIIKVKDVNWTCNKKSDKFSKTYATFLI